MFGTALAYIAAAFFMARISLAAAIAAGEPGLSAGACCWAGACWALAGRPASASTTKAAGNVLKTLFIPIFSYCGSRPIYDAYSLRARQDCRFGQPDEQPVFHDAGCDAQKARQAAGVLYASKMDVDNPVSAIGDKNVAVPGR